jgi:hypothetical protein
MQKQSIKFLLLLAALAFTIKAVASDRWETLRAINWVENPTNQTHMGRFGELGPYQFRAATWRMHTDKPFRMAIDRAAADEVAVKHYEWIKHTLEQAGVEASAFNIAMAWNCGVDAVLAGRVPTVSYGYAERVTNLVQTFKERSRATADEVAPPVDRPSLRWDEPHDRGEEFHFQVLQDVPRFVLAAN